MKKLYIIVITIAIITISYFIYNAIKTCSSIIYNASETGRPQPAFLVGDKVDSLNGVFVYYNGRVSHCEGRNTAKDGYIIGLKYQCVEFVKRYYYEFYHHKMPNPYGNAKDFYDSKIKDGTLNSARNLLQFSNPSKSKPKVGDLIILDGHFGNKYGHVAIISAVCKNHITIIQQNPGVFNKSRIDMGLDFADNKFKIYNGRVLGWLRMR